MRIIFAGSGEFGLPTLRALVERRQHEIVLVISQPDRPAGRGRRLTPTPISQFAIELNLPLLRTADINSEVLPEADLMLVIAFGQKISQSQVNHPRLGSINLHGSRLPKYRGAGPVNAAIIAGDTVSGNTIIRVAEKMDAGAILGQSSLPIGELETAGELHDRLAEDGVHLAMDVIDQLEQGTAIETPQDDSLATRAPKLSRQAAHVDWSRPAAQIARQIRGMYPWPGCHVEIVDEAGNVVSRATLARVRSAGGNGAAGTVLEDGRVGTGGGLLEVVALQPEGKRPMDLGAFRNGHPWRAGMKLRSH